MPADIGHNELLGGHGNDTIYAGPHGDVIWGDYKAAHQPSSQLDNLYGGPGRDFLYASHGTNLIHTGGGRDTVKAKYGRGEIYCDSASVLVYLSHNTRAHYKLAGCSRITYATETMLNDCTKRVARRHPHRSLLRRWRDCERAATIHIKPTQTPAVVRKR